jgi:DNA-binding GntR family transcriptional regulator
VASSQPSGSSTLAVALADRLRDMIIEGELPAGTRLNERALCDRLGASRTPLREAFRLLAADHLVELQPNRGATVVSLSDDDIRESFEVMGALEALSGELACQRITAEEVAEIKAERARSRGGAASTSSRPSTPANIRSISLPR